MTADKNCNNKDQQLKEDDLKIKILLNALRESLKLQSHYAKLLNMYDGGKRMQFDSIEKWLDRLEEIAK